MKLSMNSFMKLSVTVLYISMGFALFLIILSTFSLACSISVFLTRIYASQVKEPWLSSPIATFLALSKY